MWARLIQRLPWYRTSNPYQLDHRRIAHLTHQREEEWAQMQRYLANESCLMQFLAEALDDPEARPCGRCSVCLGRPVLPVEIDRTLLIRAQQYVKHSETRLELKKQWDIGALRQYQAKFGWQGANIPQQLRGEEGRILSRWAEPVWGELVSNGKSMGYFDQELVDASVELIRQRWPEASAARWVTCIPSRRHPELVPSFARRLAEALGIPFRPIIEKVIETEPQKIMENRFHQCHNLDGAFAIQSADEISAPVLLIDDVVDSAWTLTLATALLRQAGSAAVFPFALATTATK